MFNQLLVEFLENLGFKHFLADKSIFMEPSQYKTVYDNVAMYVDDLCIVLKYPEELLTQLWEKS